MPTAAWSKTARNRASDSSPSPKAGSAVGSPSPRAAPVRSALVVNNLLGPPGRCPLVETRPQDAKDSLASAVSELRGMGKVPQIVGILSGGHDEWRWPAIRLYSQTKE